MNEAVSPIAFVPLYMERVWGGRELERVYGRALPRADVPYGEAWELVDREEEQSVVRDGPFEGMSLNELWNSHRESIFGACYAGLGDRFPILMKILDARDDLSIQVHPPAERAAALDGEPKTEMWYIAACEKGAKLYVGFRQGGAAEDFGRALENGTVAECVHAIEPSPGDSIFIPSGRLHAIGAGFLIHEIQQNSDTTYRVFDWNRLGLDGNPRELHVEKSLASIDFADFEPSMDVCEGDNLAVCPHFRTDRLHITGGSSFQSSWGDRFAIVSVTDGVLESADGRTFRAGDTLLLPAGARPLVAQEQSTVLLVTLPVAED